MEQLAESSNALMIVGSVLGGIVADNNTICIVGKARRS
jgi:hypothetical protein